MRNIGLTKGYLAIVDDEDYERVAGYRWSANISFKSKVYPVACIGGKNHYMHRFILGLGKRKDDSRVIDHIDGNTLNNTRANLRICTASENARNTRKLEGKASRFKGAQAFQGKWQTAINVNGEKHYFGMSDHEVMAAVLYNKHARRLHGEFAKLNSLRFEKDITGLLERKEMIEQEIRRLCDMELEVLQ
jgi:hypothetical protein